MRDINTVIREKMNRIDHEAEPEVFKEAMRLYAYMLSRRRKSEQEEIKQVLLEFLKDM